MQTALNKRAFVMLFVAIAMVSASSSTAMAQQTQAEEESEIVTPFRFANEEFYYSIRVNGVEALRVGVRSGDVKYRRGTPYVPVSGTAQSTGFFHSIYPVYDRAHTYLSPTTLRPIRSEKYFKENGETREYKVDFTHSTYHARVEKRKEDRTNKFSLAIPGTTHDMITWFYALRSRDDLEIGESITYFVYDGWKLSRITGRVVKREDVHTPMGWFKAWRIDFVRDVMNSRRQRNKAPILRVRTDDAAQASLWVSRDENRLPIKIRVSTSWGGGEAVLIKFKLPGLP